ncbi:MAG: Rieske 2Fe-2S domain-containing protein [Alphaproteobacteria bacterium]|nr:Rieske 2Fe-2S domain-containing protein [Alphaproteobacteria bacterium]
MAWIDVAAANELAAKGKAIARVGGRQITLFQTERGLFACNNRCPHEGYPLAQGTVSDGCVLTCNWHNWKFDLATGETLVGGDALRRYRTRIRKGRVEIDVVEPKAGERQARALRGFGAALADQDYQRLAREIARLEQAGGDGREALRHAIVWSHDRYEFGMTHAYAVTADWLALRGGTKDPAKRLAALVEAAGHMADDADAARRHPFASGRRRWDEAAFAAAIEREDEASAIRLARGAVGMPPARLLPILAGAALAHYQDFGHSLIYAVKAMALIDNLGPAMAEPVLLALVRGLIYASREDLLPEFRSYRDHVANWGRDGGKAPVLAPDALVGRNAAHAMAAVAAWSARHSPEAIYEVVLTAAARHWLGFDTRYERRTDGPVADNIGWLDFTHAITFGNAARATCRAAPELWPPALLQLACFVGRNAGYIDCALIEHAAGVQQPKDLFGGAVDRLFDHGQGEFIISCHLVKTTLAAQAEAAAVPAAAADLAAALARFLAAPIKRRHSLRTARQMLDFVAAE